MDAQDFISTYGVHTIVEAMGKHTAVYPGQPGERARTDHRVTWAIGWSYPDEQGHTRLMVSQYGTSVSMGFPDSDEAIADALIDLVNVVKDGMMTFEEYLTEYGDRGRPRHMWEDWIAAVHMSHQAEAWLAYQPVGDHDKAAAKAAGQRRENFLAVCYSRNEE